MLMVHGTSLEVIDLLQASCLVVIQSTQFGGGFFPCTRDRSVAPGSALRAIPELHGTRVWFDFSITSIVAFAVLLIPSCLGLQSLTVTGDASASLLPTPALSRPSEQLQLKTSNACFGWMGSIGSCTLGITRPTKQDRTENEVQYAYCQTSAHLPAMLLHVLLVKDQVETVQLGHGIIHPQISPIPGTGLHHSPVTHPSKRN